MKQLIYIDLDGTLCDIKKLARQKFKESPEIKYPQSQYGFFMEMEEIKDGIEVFKKLAILYDV
jgi:5'-nucleotidase